MIVFENPGEIDIRSISTFGVSVKESDNPIGFFGTGLKYAIAVLLRNGCSITIFSGTTSVEFGLANEELRGKTFQFVTMAIDGGKPQSIGFTTELGKQWELWMAYREIACNCKDEGGKAFNVHADVTPAPGLTRVIVTGAMFEAVHASRHEYLLEDAPDFHLEGLEIRKRPGNAMFYRGVRVMQLQHTALYTYNITDEMELTEDRTIKSSYAMQMKLAASIFNCEDEALLYSILTAGENTFEGQIDYHWSHLKPGDAFMKVMGDCIQDRLTRVSASALRMFNEHTQRTMKPREIELTKIQKISMEKALNFCEHIGFPIRDNYPIKVVESLGEGCLGLAKDQTIYIAERVFHLGGTKQLASTLIEEYLHLRQGWLDLTRELQSFLFDKVVSLGEELIGEPL